MGEALSGLSLLHIARRCEKTIQMIIEIAKKEHGITIPLKLDAIVPSNIAKIIISAYGTTKPIKEKRHIQPPAKVKKATIKPINKKGIEVGKRYKGTIKKIHEKSLLVKIEDLVGIVPIRNMFWGYPRRHLDEIFEEGQELEVEVSEPLSYDDNGKPLITLSHKVCIPNYWYDDCNYPIGTICEGYILKINDNGIIVEIEPGFEGFVPVSELSHSILNMLNQFSEKQLKDVSKDFEVRIIDKDPDNMRLILSVLQTSDNWLDRWENINEAYSIGDTYESIIVGIERERLWVSLKDGLEASISKYEVAWPKVYHNDNEYHCNDEVKVMLLNIDQEKKRISASIKKCEPNPWDIIVENVNIDDTIAFNVIEKRQTGYNIVACDNLNLLGFLPSSEVSWNPYVNDLELNKKYSGKVLELSAKSSTLKVSLKRTTPNPWESIIVGRIIRGTIISNDEERLIIKLGNGLTGFTTEKDIYQKGIQSDYKVIGFNTLSKEIQLSHNRIQFDSETDRIVKDFFDNRNI